MKLVEGESRDHPHHRSLWFTHGSVNGIDFWSETPAAGKEVHREYLKCKADGSTGVISTVNDWLGPDGKKQCEDVRTRHISAATSTRANRFRYHDQGQRRSRAASAIPRRHRWGCVYPRRSMRDSSPASAGEIVTSEGARNGAAWGKPAAVG